ncbi:hypothetical protein B296_00039037 [Ensete ventricosum]|uniref:Uncharacterized protein n=1 Tax=Ensete ventricosum TaxID=4639 RepID=A0A426ZUN2_ENSVE|nr:hypothetical protein B296_00039037 [Ensete ventricosum]
MYLSGLVRVNDEIRPGRVTVLGILSQAVPMEGITRVHPKPLRRPLCNRDPELQAAEIARFFLRSKSLRARRRVRGQKSCRFEVSLDMLKSPFFPFPDSLEVGKKRKNLEPDAALPIPIRRLRDPSPARSVTRGPVPVSDFFSLHG